MRGDLDLGRRLGVYINQSNQSASIFLRFFTSLRRLWEKWRGDAPAVGISWAGWVMEMPSRTGTSSSFALKYDESSGGMREARAREPHCSRQAAAWAEENFIGDRLRQDGFEEDSRKRMRRRRDPLKISNIKSERPTIQHPTSHTRVSVYNFTRTFGCLGYQLNGSSNGSLAVNSCGFRWI